MNSRYVREVRRKGSKPPFNSGRGSAPDLRDPVLCLQRMIGNRAVARKIEYQLETGNVRVPLDKDAIEMHSLLPALPLVPRQYASTGISESADNNALTAGGFGLGLGKPGQAWSNKPPQLQHDARPWRDESDSPVEATRLAANAPREPGRVPAIQRAVELRPPGAGEASAFERRQELIDRLNAQSPAIRYRLVGNSLNYDIVDAAALTNFDRQMSGFIDRAEVVPMRLITRGGYVSRGPAFVPLLVDSLQLAYLDLDDTLASDDLSFQMNLIHLLVERFQVPDYERRIGTDMGAEFDQAHRAGLEAEAAHLREVIGDPTIRFNYVDPKPNGTLVFGFVSDEGYHVFHVFRRRTGREEVGGHIFTQWDGRRMTVEELRTERARRAALAPVPAPP